MNITLVGMAGAGKSSVGEELARRINYRFIDTDTQIEDKRGLTLQKLLDESGDDKFVKIEEEMVLKLGDIDRHIISPGGSVVYSEKAMRFLKRKSVVVFLNAGFDTIRQRLVDKETRGIVRLKGRSLRTLFDERALLYQKYADIQIDTFAEFDIHRIVDEIIRKVFAAAGGHPSH